jgi:argininosuccinate lyase
MSRDKPWGGRFREGTDPAVERFTASIYFDRELARHDICGSIAHARISVAGVVRRTPTPSSPVEAIVGDLKRARQS